MKLNKKPIFIILIIIFSCSFIYSIYEIGVWFLEKKHIDKQMDELIDYVSEDTSSTLEEDIESKIIDNNKEDEKKEEDKENYYTSFLEENYLNVDFEKLKKINNSTLGWIKVNGTYINYPIVKASNNEYYLNRSFDKTYNSSGWIYMDYRNNKDILKNKNTIIYGHGRFDKIMFGSLKTVVKNNWFKNTSSKTIKLTTENYKTVWEIFSVYTIKPESYYISTEFNNDNEYDEFLKTITNRSIHNFGVSVNTDDIILTLSSCYNDSKRVVMHAKLSKKTKVD